MPKSTTLPIPRAAHRRASVVRDMFPPGDAGYDNVDDLGAGRRRVAGDPPSEGGLSPVSEHVRAPAGLSDTRPISWLRERATAGVPLEHGAVPRGADAAARLR